MTSKHTTGDQPKGTLKSWWNKIGLEAQIALVALALAVLGLIFNSVQMHRDKSALQQEEAARESDNATQSTAIAIMKAQYGVQIEVATLQASDIRDGPIATAEAARVAQLLSTQEAQIDQNSTAIEAPAVSPVVPSATRPSDDTGSRTVVPSQKPSLSAELIEFSLYQNMITVKVRYINSGEQRHVFIATGASYLLDESTGKEYPVTKQGSPGNIVIAAGTSMDVWAKYTISADELPQSLTVILGPGVLFEHLKVQ